MEEGSLNGTQFLTPVHPIWAIIFWGNTLEIPVIIF